MPQSFTNLIIQEFENKIPINTRDLFLTLSNNPNVTLYDEDLKHRIRSVLFRLRQSQKIKRISQGEYVKL